MLTTDGDGFGGVLAVDRRRPVEIAPRLRIRYCPRLFRRSVSPTLLRLLASYVELADVVHLQVAYSFPTIPTVMACRMLSKPLVWSPRGALQRWTGTRRPQAKLLWERVCRLVAPRSMVMHVTSEAELIDTAARMPGVPTALIPNGVAIPERVGHLNGDARLRLGYLGRLDPKKGIENLVHACRILEESGFQYSLVIAGSGTPAYEESMRALIERLSLAARVEMVGQVPHQRLEDLFRRIDVAVVPSYVENFGNVVVEALAHGVPVIAGRGTPWKRMEEMHCGLWVENDSESLAQAIRRIGRMPLWEMGERGRRWMKQEFSWEESAQKMHDLYSRLIMPTRRCSKKVN